jgi:hypothetical protein
MIAWRYKAALYCDDCATAIIVNLEEREIDDTNDSGSYPQGPLRAGGGLADAPASCETCGEFLCNQLTTEGREYLRARLRDDPEDDIVQHWGEYYGIVAFDAPPRLMKDMHGRVVYKTQYGWRRFIVDVTPLQTDMNMWTLSGWVVLNTGDDETSPLVSHSGSRLGNELGCWNWLDDVKATLATGVTRSVSRRDVTP